MRLHGMSTWSDLVKKVEPHVAPWGAEEDAEEAQARSSWQVVLEHRRGLALSKWLLHRSVMGHHLCHQVANHTAHDTCK